MSGFYDVGPIREVAINLFYGWGYNFYRAENQLRADDQLVRTRAADLLAQARAAVDAAEQAYRRERLPPPTRANPVHDPAAVANAQALERMGREIGALAARIHNLPVPENDRMTQRYRQEAETLVRLGECDQDLVGQAALLRREVAGQGGEDLLAKAAIVAEGVAALKATLERRGALLS